MGEHDYFTDDMTPDQLARAESVIAWAQHAIADAEKRAQRGELSPSELDQAGRDLRHKMEFEMLRATLSDGQKEAARKSGLTEDQYIERLMNMERGHQW